MNFDTPVALFIYHRPLQTARVFSRLALAQPRQLFIVADGPASAADVRASEAARAVVADIDWDCDVCRSYSDLHLGCRRRMSSGIDWVFSQCERAILLEDDCLPDMSFFPYCQSLLERYADDDRVMTISGDNFQFGVQRTPFSYYFSAIPHLWGWATWRRAWNHYDVDMKQWPMVASTNFPGDMIPQYAARYHREGMAETHAGRRNTWDHQWVFACWMRRALCALPAVNLVSNIGFGPNATHCKTPTPLASLPTQPIDFPLIHPPKVDLCADADEAFLRRAIKAA
jgi:hypothetical protein